jgi:hypothetical protein
MLSASIFWVPHPFPRQRKTDNAGTIDRNPSRHEIRNIDEISTSPGRICCFICKSAHRFNGRKTGNHGAAQIIAHGMKHASSWKIKKQRFAF